MTRVKDLDILYCTILGNNCILTLICTCMLCFLHVRLDFLSIHVDETVGYTIWGCSMRSKILLSLYLVCYTQH